MAGLTVEAEVTDAMGFVSAADVVGAGKADSVAGVVVVPADDGLAGWLDLPRAVCARKVGDALARATRARSTVTG